VVAPQRDGRFPHKNPPRRLLGFSIFATHRMTRMREVHAYDGERNVLEFDFGVRAYPPVNPDGYWRLRWEERRTRKDTTAKSPTAAIAKATEIVERLARSAPTELGRATGADLVAQYLDPGRRPPRVKSWSIRLALRIRSQMLAGLASKWSTLRHDLHRPAQRPVLRRGLRRFRPAHRKGRRRWHPFGHDRDEAEAVAARLEGEHGGRQPVIGGPITLGAFLTDT
jgi:hypothetical protein